MNNLNPDWKLLYVSLSELCDNDFNMMLKVMLLIKLLTIFWGFKLQIGRIRIGGFELNLFQIDVWDEDKSSRNDLIGSVQVTIYQIALLGFLYFNNQLIWVIHQSNP